MVTVVVVVAPEAEREVVVVDRWRSARDGLPAIAAGLLDDEASPLLLSPPLSLVVDDDEPRAATVPPTRDDGARVVRARRPGRPGKAFWSSPDGPDSPCDSGMFAARLPLQIHQDFGVTRRFTKHLLAPGLALPMSCSVIRPNRAGAVVELGDQHEPCERALCCCSCP